MQSCTNSHQSLSDLRAGERAIYQSIAAERAVTSRLTSMGFTPGVEIEMVQNYGRGPLLVTIRGTRVALGRQEARNITIQKETAQ